MGKKAAEAILVRVRDLIDIQAAGLPLNNEISAWLAKTGDDIHDKLVGVELIAPRISAMLDEFIQKYIEGRVDTQPPGNASFIICGQAGKRN